MGVRILQDSDGQKCLYCSTTMWAFGPLFYEEDDPEDFLEWLSPVDPRVLTDKQLNSYYYQWKESIETL